MATAPIDYKLPRKDKSPSKCIEMNSIYYDVLKRTSKCKILISTDIACFEVLFLFPEIELSAYKR